MTDLVDLPNTENAPDLNEDNYDDLIVSIEASENRLSILIAVCDDPQYRDQIIDRYETELQPDIKPYRIKLDRGEPSLRAALSRLVTSDEYLQNGGQAVITVTGTEELYFLKLGEERSEQEIFFGYLQWTREGLREFPYPIVLWVNTHLKNSIIKKAPDFWSWRKGVFTFSNTQSPQLQLFDSKEKFLAGIYLRTIFSKFSKLSDDLYTLMKTNEGNYRHFNGTPLILDDLEEIINRVEKEEIIESNQFSTLIVLYEMVGQNYQELLQNSRPENYKKAQDIVIKYFEKAIALRKEIGSRNGLDNALANLGNLYEAQGEYEKAKQLYQEALDILIEQGNYVDAIARLNNLAGIHHLLGEYEKAIELYKQALAIYEDGKDTDIATYASTKNFMAGTYHAQGKYPEAETLYQEALKIRIKEFGEFHPDVAVSLNNLGLLYVEQGKFEQAKSSYEQAIAIQRDLLGGANPDIATSLNNLALLYYSQGRFSEAETNLQEALNIRQKLLGEYHPDVAGSLNNLAGLYKAQGRFAEAEPLYEQALAIATTKLGVDHPITLRFQESLAKLKTELISSQEV